MCEAFEALRIGLGFASEAKTHDQDSLVANDLNCGAGMQCRYAFLLAANALEAAANAVLLGLETGQASYSDLERLPTLLKFEIFCLAKGKTLDRGDNLYACVKDAVKCRNAFVHPKPTKAPTELSSDGSTVDIITSRTKTKGYPTYFSVFEPDHSRDAIGHILAFLSWVVFDICKYEQKAGCLLLGYESYGSTGSVSIVGEEHGFDLRTFDTGMGIEMD